MKMMVHANLKKETKVKLWVEAVNCSGFMVISYWKWTKTILLWNLGLEIVLGFGLIFWCNLEE